MENQIKCPKCGSNQISANKKGWTLSTGMIGANNILITCLNCGKQFKPGTTYKPQGQPAIVWDEKLKKHVRNPQNTNNDTLTMGIVKFFVVLGLFGIVLYFLLK